MVAESEIIQTIVNASPSVVSIYLFGSYGTGDEFPDSDVDIAILLPHDLAKETGNFYLHPLHADLERLLRKDVDLINIRLVSTVFQIQIMKADRRIYCNDRYAGDEFEVYVMSAYQLLNWERREIIEDGLKSGRFIQ